MSGPVFDTTERPIHVHALLTDRTRRRPDDEVLRFQGQSMTWAKLTDRVARGAAALRAAGLTPGARVAVLDLNHPSCLEITLACAQVGTVNVAVNFRLTAAEIEYVINDAQAEMLFVGPELEPTVTAILDRLPTVRRVVRVGGDHDEYDRDWLSTDPDHEVYLAEPDECVLQLYTSGTTGFPKGAMLTHRGLLAHSASLSAAMSADETSSVLVVMPLFHAGGSSYALTALYAGSRLVLVRTPVADQLPALLASEHITHTVFAPALLAAFIAVEGVGQHDYSALRVLGYGASPIPLPVLRASMDIFPDVLMQFYGTTETTGVISVLGTAEHADADHPRRLVSAGTQLSGCEIEIHSPESGAPVPTGDAGEIWVRTPQLMLGYWNNPAATAAVIDTNGWYHTGDAGYLDADGYVYITDRIKDLIVSGGENIYPAEIERVLAEHQSVADLTVIGVPDDRWGEVPKAVVVAADGHIVDEAELLAYCHERLAPYKCPKSVDTVDELPRNSTGKILKKDVRAKYWEGRERRTV